MDADASAARVLVVVTAPKEKPAVPGVLLSVLSDAFGVEPHLMGSGEPKSLAATAADDAPGVAPKENPRPLAGAGVCPASAVLIVANVPGVAAAVSAAWLTLGVGAKLTDLLPPPVGPLVASAVRSAVLRLAAGVAAGVLPNKEPAGCGPSLELPTQPASVDIEN